MSIASDVRFWDRTSRKYARSAIADQAGYDRTLSQIRALLELDHQVLELGCGTGSTALLLAGEVSRYLATDISGQMIAIAQEKSAAATPPTPEFRTADAETLAREGAKFDVVLGLNYLHLVRDLPGTLRTIHSLLEPDGLFISKTPCLGDMNPFLRHVLLPVMKAIGVAPYVNSFPATDLRRLIGEAGFEIRAVESHASAGKDTRPYIVAVKR